MERADIIALLDISKNEYIEAKLEMVRLRKKVNYAVRNLKEYDNIQDNRSNRTQHK